MKIFRWFAKSTSKSQKPNLKLVKNTKLKEENPHKNEVKEAANNVYSLQDRLKNSHCYEIKRFLNAKCTKDCSACGERHFIFDPGIYGCISLLNTDFTPRTSTIPLIIQTCKNCGLINLYGLPTALPKLMPKTSK